MRQINRYAGREQWCRDHEDDEQHEHDVDERRHVDVGHRLVTRHPAGGDGRPGHRLAP